MRDAKYDHGTRPAETNPDHPMVDVIVPVFNDAARLERCLVALAEQSYHEESYRVTVVDNGSSEDIRAVCRRHANVRYLREDNPGSYAARNRAIAETDAPILAFTDADCLPEADWLAHGVSRLRGTPDCGLVGGHIDIFFADPDRPTSVELYERALAFPQQHFVEANHWAATANMFTLRSVVEDVGPFDEVRRSGGDADWGRRVHAAGYRLEYEPQAVVRHPSRVHLSEIRRKEIRVAGGLYRMILDRDDSLRYFLYYLARMSYYTLRKTGAILAGRTVMARDMDEHGLSERARIAFVLDYVHMIRTVELLRLRIDTGREEAR